MNWRAVLLITILSPARCGAEDPVAVQILSSLEEFQQSINSLDVQYVVKDSPTWEFTNMEQQPSYKWRWAKSGRKQLLTRETALIPDTTTLSRIWESFDGENGYIVNYHDREQTLVKRIDVTPVEPITLMSNQHIAGGFGTHKLHLHIPDSLTAFLGKRMAMTVSSEEKVEEEDCVKLSIGKVAAFVDGGPEHNVTAWFSKRCGFMLRRIAVLPVVPNPGDGKTIRLPEGSFPSFVDVVQYTEVNDPLFRKVRWFPAKIQYRNFYSGEVTVQSVSINTEIPAETFVPEMPNGTEVLTIRPGSTTPLTHYVCGEGGARLYEERMRSFNTSKPILADKQPKPVNASPESTGYVQKVFVACSVFMIIAAIVAAKRQGRWFSSRE